MQLKSLEETNNFSKYVSKIISAGDVIFLYGEIGVGKMIALPDEGDLGGPKIREKSRKLESMDFRCPPFGNHFGSSGPPFGSISEPLSKCSA